MSTRAPPNPSPPPPFSVLPSAESTLPALEEALPSLGASPAVQTSLRNLSSFRPPPSTISFPKNRLASVLVLLHLSKDGKLAVTLTTRSRRMRSHPGETALPGGRSEDGDVGVEGTALREAFEEVSLPLPPTSPLLHLTTLSAYTSRTLLIVVPCVYLLLLPSDQAQDYLDKTLVGNPDEVESIFTCDLDALLSLDSEEQSDGRATRSHSSSSYIYSYIDFNWPLDPPTPYRLHSFVSPSFSSAITGLTADILIDTSSIARFGPSEESLTKEIGFERIMEGQAGWEEIVKRALSMDRGKREGRGEAVQKREEREVKLNEIGKEEVRDNVVES